MTTAYLLLGSNTTDALANLTRAVALLRRHDDVDVRALSSVYQSPAQPTVANHAPGPDYLNMAVEVVTDAAPAEFKSNVLYPIERQLGRDRTSPEARRVVPLDIDILLWGDTPIVYGDRPWRSPAPDIERHAHAAVPLAELAPDRRHPETGERFAAIAARFDTAPISKIGPLPPGGTP